MKAYLIVEVVMLDVAGGILLAAAIVLVPLVIVVIFQQIGDNMTYRRFVK